ncbi:UNKNOWN [Stylonychia lemnae]|uniref:Uncharacterized protein n=1 Tax=Stylonychia lemnae TaxID=5949 RepID=A0A078B0I4_STYLE|nr:UNKNOWN [Stylonychia lemnae]|eukprot:CDW87821.1 UNKNOWN [Stylonychia lemnae]
MAIRYFIQFNHQIQSRRGSTLRRSNSFAEKSIYQPIQYTPMRNRKNMLEKSSTQKSSLNNSCTMKNLRNDYVKPVSTFGVIIKALNYILKCSKRAFNWEMYSSEQQEARTLKSMRSSLKNENKKGQQQSRNEPVKAFTNTVQNEYGENRLTIDEDIKVNPKKKQESFLKRVRNGSGPPSSVASLHSTISFRDEYVEPKLNTLGVESTKKLYGQGEFNIFSGQTLDERYQNRYGFAPQPKKDPSLKQLNTKLMKKLHGQGEFDPLSGKTYDERYKERYAAPHSASTQEKNLPQKQQSEKYNSNNMKQVLSSQSNAIPKASQISEKPNRANSQNLSSRLTIKPNFKQLQLDQINSLKTDISMKNVATL